MSEPIVAIVPAAGVGSRMKANKPKQYLTINGKTVLEHTVEKLLLHPKVETVVVAVSKVDPYFSALPIAQRVDVIRVDGGSERADSVLSGLKYINDNYAASLALVHDAARPCVSYNDIDRLIQEAQSHEHGAILASPVRDTMKRGDSDQDIQHTVERGNLWHALTPQLFRSQELEYVLTQALNAQATITDEASAFEWAKLPVRIVAGRADNIKITQPEDLALAKYYLDNEREQL